MKHEWRKKEKDIYLTKKEPILIQIPEYKFLTIEGEGNPNSDAFSEYIGALYSVSYAIKMTLKKEPVLKGYFDYTVYPLEGVWDLTVEAKKNYNGKINKDDLIFKLMIRQPGFVDSDYVKKMIELSINRKPSELLNKVKFEKTWEGKCVQMMHMGSYDDEHKSFKLMEEFAGKEKLSRKSKKHREIYLSDFRKVAPEKLKTILRFKVD